MSQQPAFADPSFDATPVDFDDAFDAWLGGATIAKRSVAVYGKPGLYAEYETLARELEIAEAAEKGDESLGSAETADLRRRLAALYEEWVASKSTWIVRALSSDEVEAITDEIADLKPEELVEPRKPAPLPQDASQTAQRSHTVQMQAFERELAAFREAVPAHRKKMTRYTTELNFRFVAEAVERVDFADGRGADGVTLDQVRRFAATLGERQVLKLVQTAQLAMVAEPEIPAPFSPSTSENDQT